MASAFDVTLAWDASSGADGYRLFVREEGNSYNYSSPDWDGTATTGIVTGLAEGTTYYFVVRAYNAYGESGDSKEKSATPGGFVDVPSNYWAEDYIYAIYDAGITTGCALNPLLYCPQNDVNRAQMAAFLVRAVEGEPHANYCATGSPFSDVPPTHPMCKYIKRLSELGITTGYSDGTYRPTLSVNRAQMAAFIVRAVEGEPPANYCDTGSPFTDIDPSFPMCKYIKRLFELGITTGYSDGTYRPTLFVNRTQMAAFLARAFLGMP